MQRLLRGIGLLLLGVGLMANPLYLPIGTAEVGETYLHTVHEADATTPDYDQSVAYTDLSAAAQETFDRARDAEAGYSVDDPGEQLRGFSYPTPTDTGPGASLTVVTYDGTDYEFWTRTAEREGSLLLVQRGLVQPGLFLGGLFALVGGAIQAGGIRLSRTRPER
jgi:hypothetical protein